MKLIARDSFYTDETKMISGKQEFEVESEAFGKDLIKRGLVVEAGEKSEKPAPQNKNAGAAPQNKAAK